MLLAEIIDELRDDDGDFDLDLCEIIWVIASVDSFEEVPQGSPVYLGRVGDGYCWHFDFEDTIFAFDNVAEAKAELARADSATSIPLFVVNLADLFRYASARHPRERAEAVEQLLSKPFFKYLSNRSAWVSDKRGRQ